MRDLEFIRDIIAKNKYKYAFGILSLIVVDTLQLVLPRVLGIMTDLLKSGELNKSRLAVYTGIVAGIALGIAVFRFTWRYMVYGVAKSIEMHLRNRFYHHLQKLSPNYYNNHKTGDLMAHATSDINNVSTALGQGVAFAFDSAIIPVAAIAMMFRTGGIGLTLASFGPLAVMALIIVFNVDLMHRSLQKIQEAFSQLTERTRENISGIRVVKAFAQEKHEEDKFRETNINNRNTVLKYTKVTSSLFPMIGTISAFSFVIALWYGGVKVIYGDISLGSFVSFNSYLGMLIWPIAALGWIVSIFQRASVSIKRINAIMREKPEIQDAPNVVPLRGIKGRIEFRNLTFTYPGASRPALKNINLLIEEGKTLAIVGRTGSGKTTLINLIQRLYNVEEGMLLIDGVDINRIPLSVLRGSMGYVPQDTFLFSSTIRENIDFFCGRDDESIINASKIAQVYENIMDFPEKFETMVGERGVTLSGGQKQRIAIARAIVRDPEVLLLDDCLSAVDTNTEEEILKGLKDVLKNRTSVVVSHRISSIKHADEIIVLDDGEIIERGTHDSLLKLKGEYYDLYQKQLLAEQIEGEDEYELL